MFTPSGDKYYFWVYNNKVAHLAISKIRTHLGKKTGVTVKLT